jgi:two-component sensor histidine kinase
VVPPALLEDGRIAIGTSHDLLVFNPSEAHNLDLSTPDIHITSFALMNNALLVDSLLKQKMIELPYDKNSINITFSTLTYQNNFSTGYMLEGLDKTWKNSLGSNQAIYTYLPSGNYTFKVKVESGGNAAKYLALKIRVKPPFWKTWWFLGLLAFAAIGVIFSFDKFRVGRIRETERVRTRIATSLTRDMTNTLSNINVLSELSKVKLDRDNERTRDYIEQISESSNRMMEVMDDMIWSINPENDELKHTIARMKKYAALIQTKYELEVSFTIDSRVNDFKLHMDRRHELFLIFKEALLNTGKHARSRFADVDIRLEKHKLKMSVSDNGNGFDTKGHQFRPWIKRDA